MLISLRECWLVNSNCWEKKSFCRQFVIWISNRLQYNLSVFHIVFYIVFHMCIAHYPINDQERETNQQILFLFQHLPLRLKRIDSSFFFSLLCSFRIFRNKTKQLEQRSSSIFHIWLLYYLFCLIRQHFFETKCSNA